MSTVPSSVYICFGFALLILFFISLLLAKKRSSSGWKQFALDWLAGASYDLAAALILTIVFGFLLAHAQDAQLKAINKSQLIGDMGSAVNEIALRAVEEIKSSGYLKDGSLQGLDFSFADLRNAPLGEGELAGADFRYANLVGADLSGANLTGANFFNANLQEARLCNTNLSRANLNLANLSDAVMYLANCGQKYAPSYEYGYSPLFDETTILPNGTYWNKTIDMYQFTDSLNPNFVPFQYQPTLVPWSPAPWIPTVTPLNAE